MFCVYNRESLGELILICPAKLTLPKSVANSLANTFLSLGGFPVVIPGEEKT